MHIWQLQEAKNKFSRLFNEVLENGPQIVSRHGKDEVVILSKSKYLELTHPQKSVVDVLLEAPKVDLDLTRSKESIRDLEF